MNSSSRFRISVGASPSLSRSLPLCLCSLTGFLLLLLQTVFASCVAAAACCSSNVQLDIESVEPVCERAMLLPLHRKDTCIFSSKRHTRNGRKKIYSVFSVFCALPFCFFICTIVCMFIIIAFSLFAEWSTKKTAHTISRARSRSRTPASVRNYTHDIINCGVCNVRMCKTAVQDATHTVHLLFQRHTVQPQVDKEQYVFLYIIILPFLNMRDRQSSVSTPYI